MKIPFKLKTLMCASIFFFIILFSLLFGSNNMSLAMTLALAAFSNTSNDLHSKPVSSFFALVAFFCILAFCAFLNYPLSIFGCVLTCFVVFFTTMSSYRLFGANTYISYLMIYFMMSCIPVEMSEMPLRLGALTVAAFFIVLLNIIANKKQPPAPTAKSFISAISEAIDAKLNNETETPDKPKASNTYFTDLFYKLKFKIFPSTKQESETSIANASQHIIGIIMNYNLSKTELKYIKKVIDSIEDINPADIAKGVKITTKEMNVVLLNLEIIADETQRNDTSEKEYNLPDRKTLREIFKSVIKGVFSLNSVRFNFALKMTFLLTLSEVLAFALNLTLPQWIYFAIIPLLMPYINDMAGAAKTRTFGTWIGVAIFALIAILIPYIPISSDIVSLIIFVLCVIGFVYNLQSTFLVTLFTTVLSMVVTLSSLAVETAVWMKLVYVTTATLITAAFTFLVLPYSVEKETKVNLTARSKLHNGFIAHIKDKLFGDNSTKATSFTIMNYLLGENTEVTKQNSELFSLQNEITNIAKFVSTYIDKNEASKEFKENALEIINNGHTVSKKASRKEQIVLHSIKYLMELIQKEKKLLKTL